MSPGSEEDPTGGEPEEGPVLSPEELDIADDERVMELDDGRYVVSSGDPIENTKPDTSSAIESGSDGRSQPEYEDAEPSPNPATPAKPAKPAKPDPASNQAPQPTETSELTQQDVHQWLSDDLDASGSRYGFDITAAFDGGIAQQRMVSNDVVTIFENLVVWYAQHIDRNTPVEEVLGILLMEANVPVRYPPDSIKQALQSSGLSPDDSIADLLQVLNENEGLQL